MKAESMKKEKIEIDIGRQFSRLPAGRTPKDGKFCGETFREKFLKDPLKRSQEIRIFLDNVLSYGSSFLEEAFGGLVRVYNIKVAKFDDLVELVTEDPFLRAEIYQYMKSAEREVQ